jgi:hypothetical protein
MSNGAGQRAQRARWYYLNKHTTHKPNTQPNYQQPQKICLMVLAKERSAHDGII